MTGGQAGGGGWLGRSCEGRLLEWWLARSLGVTFRPRLRSTRSAPRRRKEWTRFVVQLHLRVLLPSWRLGPTVSTAAARLGCIIFPRKVRVKTGILHLWCRSRTAALDIGGMGAFAGGTEKRGGVREERLMQAKALELRSATKCCLRSSSGGCSSAVTST